MEDFSKAKVVYTVLAATALYIVFRVGTRWRRTRAQRSFEDAFAVQHGCLPMKAYTKGKWPYNVDLVKGLLEANSDMRLLAFQTKFLDELGHNLEQRLLGDVGLVTIDPENVRAILSKTEWNEDGLGFVMGTRRDAFLPLLGEGLFTQDGADWKVSRELLRKQFARIQYQKLDVFTHHVEQLVSRLSSGDAVKDLQPLFFNYTLDTTTSLLFGESSDTLNPEKEDTFGDSFDEATAITALRVKLVDFYWVYTPPRYRRVCNNVKAYADAFVKKGLEKGEADTASSERYAFIQNIYKELRSPVLVRDQLVNVLLAGRDTTACLLSWTFRLLIRHPTVLARLRVEIESVLGGETFVTRSRFQKLPYLHDIIDEVLRLYPSVPINVRSAKVPSILPRGGGDDGLAPVMVRKGQGVGFSPYHMHRRTDIFGEDALDFRPERWAEPGFREKIGWAYLPFNGGPRVCLGKDFAIMEAAYAIIRIVQSFPKMGLPADEKVEPVGMERQLLTLVVSPADGCRVKLW